MYEKLNNEAFSKKIQKAQYDAELPIIGAVRRTSWEKLYAELDLESLKFGRRFRKFACFHKIQSTGLPKYLIPTNNHSQLIPTNSLSYFSRKSLNISHYYCRNDIF